MMEIVYNITLLQAPIAQAGLQGLPSRRLRSGWELNSHDASGRTVLFSLTHSTVRFITAR